MIKHPKKNIASKTSTAGFVRIISGLWKGRKLPVLDVQGLRPTTDRIKETVFNWLAQDIPKARCLDLFAGSGGLGFEAASRHAENVTLIELNVTAFKQIQKNISTLNGNNIQAINMDSLTFLKQTGTPYDIVFIDPPFRENLLGETLTLLESNGWLSKDAIIYIETEKELLLEKIPTHWHLYREKSAGQVCYRLFKRNSQ